MIIPMKLSAFLLLWPLNTAKVYVVDLTPLPGRPVAYKKLRLWIRDKDGIMVRQHFYNDDLKVTRVMQYSDIREIGGPGYTYSLENV